MNKTQATLVHATYLEIGQNYVMDHLFGKGVQVQIVGVEGKFVTIKIMQGFMRNELAAKKWDKGAELGVSVASAKFYEVQG